MSDYWQERIAKSQDSISNKSIKEVEKQLKKYYGSAVKSVINEFENTYNAYLAALAEGREPSPATLYKLDKYWELQGQLRAQLQKLGERQITALTKQFELNFFNIYYSIELPIGEVSYSTISKEVVLQMINSTWVADGKSWSQRIWDNVGYLSETLNENLINCVVTGKKTTDLKNLLQERFSVSYSAADSLVRTEIAHIQTQAAQKRYTDYGLKEVEVFVDEDERTCPICAEHEGERHKINDKMPVPFHPRCRCCMVPVID